MPRPSQKARLHSIRQTLRRLWHTHAFVWTGTGKTGWSDRPKCGKSGPLNHKIITEPSCPDCRKIEEWDV